MASTKTTFDTTYTVRDVWADVVIEEAHQESTLARLIGASRNSLDDVAFKVPMIGAGKHATVTFDAVSEMIGPALVPSDTALTSADAHYYGGTTLTRYGWGKSWQINKDELRKAPIDAVERATAVMGRWWGRQMDKIIVYHCSAGRNTYAENTAAARETALTDLTTFKTVVNLASIGTSDAASSTEVNIVFAHTQTGTVSKTELAGGNAWSTMTELNKPSVLGVRALKRYMRERGIRNTYWEVEGRRQPCYILTLSEGGVYELRQDSNFDEALMHARVRGPENEYWRGWEDAIYVDGVVILTAHTTADATAFPANTPLRSETNANDDNLRNQEGLAFGANGFAIDQYEDVFEIILEPYDGGRQPTLIADIGFGAVQLVRELADSSARNNVCSFCYTCSAAY